MDTTLHSGQHVSESIEQHDTFGVVEQHDLPNLVAVLLPSKLVEQHDKFYLVVLVDQVTFNFAKVECTDFALVVLVDQRSRTTRPFPKMQNLLKDLFLVPSW